MPSIIEISAELSRIWPELNREGPINREERIRAIISQLNQSDELAEADRRAGEAERKLASLEESEYRHSCWLSKAKGEAGYHNIISFDVVWSEILGKVKTCEAMADLIRHMWIHEGYKKNGYLQMTTEQKQMYCAAIGAEFDPIEPKFRDVETCQCRACIQKRGDTINGLPVEFSRMIVCEHCGNKRCPHANDHRNECTNSNEPGQPGSAY